MGAGGRAHRGRRDRCSRQAPGSANGSSSVPSGSAPYSSNAPLASPRCTPQTTSGYLWAASSSGQRVSRTTELRASACRREPDLVEQGDHLSSGRDRARGRPGATVARQLAPPLPSGGDGVVGRGRAGPVDRRCQRGREPGVLRGGGRVAPRGFVEPGGSAAADRDRGVAVGETVSNQRVEVFADRVGVQAGAADERREGRRLRLRPKRLQQRLPTLRQSRASSAGARARAVARGGRRR